MVRVLACVSSVRFIGAYYMIKINKKVWALQYSRLKLLLGIPASRGRVLVQVLIQVLPPGRPQEARTPSKSPMLMTGIQVLGTSSATSLMHINKNSSHSRSATPTHFERDAGILGSSLIHWTTMPMSQDDVHWDPNNKNGNKSNVSTHCVYTLLGTQ